MWKGEDKNTTTTTNQCKDPNNHFNHCNIYGPTKYKCWKLHPDVNPQNQNKNTKNTNMLVMDSSNQEGNNHIVKQEYPP